MGLTKTINCILLCLPYSVVPPLFLQVSYHINKHCIVAPLRAIAIGSGLVSWGIGSLDSQAGSTQIHECYESARPHLYGLGAREYLRVSYPNCCTALDNLLDFFIGFGWCLFQWSSNRVLRLRLE